MWHSLSLGCTNAGGTASNSATLTVSTAPTVYCSNNTPCYGPNDLAAHNTATNCWAYNSNRVVNITSLNNGFHKNNPGNLLPTGYTSICGNVNISSFLSGSSSIPNIGTHNHQSSTKSNTGTIAPYLVGYYDATKP